MTTIILPPLPEPRSGWVADDHHMTWYTADQLRARDLEVARMVLEGAANLCKQNAERWVDYRACYVANECAKAISNLEVKHHG
jgi:hypothetical protein